MKINKTILIIFIVIVYVNISFAQIPKAVPKNPPPLKTTVVPRIKDYCFSYDVNQDKKKLDTAINFPRFKELNIRYWINGDDFAEAKIVYENANLNYPITQRKIISENIVLELHEEYLEGRYSIKNNILHYISKDEKTELNFKIIKDQSKNIIQLKELKYNITLQRNKKDCYTLAEKLIEAPHPSGSEPNPVYKPSDIKNDFPDSTLQKKTREEKNGYLKKIKSLHNPSIAIKNNMKYFNTLPSDIENYIPFDEVTFKNVKQIEINDGFDESSKIVINFTQDELIKSVITTDKKDKIKSTLENKFLNGVLIESNKDGLITEYAYNKDTLWSIDKNYIQKYLLLENTFVLLSKQYLHNVDDEKNINNATFNYIDNDTYSFKHIFSNVESYYSTLKSIVPKQIKQIWNYKDVKETIHVHSETNIFYDEQKNLIIERKIFDRNNFCKFEFIGDKIKKCYAKDNKDEFILYYTYTYYK